MIQLHCTKKLYEKLPLREGGRLISKNPSLYPANDAPPTPLSGWHANLLVLQRRQCILFVHDATRFPVLLIGLKKADFADLDFWFRDGFMNTLLKTGADEAMIDRAHAAMGPLVCDTIGDRSVQGTMNQMAQSIEHLLWYEGASILDIAPNRTGVWLADRPCSAKGVKGYIWPIEAMHALLSPHRDMK